ncbi:MAG: FtsK/SpoIIIE domain-containing protein [Acutalibacteraceae bacterium]|nr:FtsK/SpoIIIE domain-containing protein [Acutalibacteraceae bacterium]
MKNNELLLTISFEADGEELMLLLYKDITLKALIETIYYGLKRNDSTHFEMFKSYVKNHAELVVYYRAKKELEFIDVKNNMDKKLYELGLVTTSCVIVPQSDRVKLSMLFPRYDMPALCDREKLEYNISTRRIAVAEPSVIDILPAGELPVGQKRSYLDVIIPTVISMSALTLSRLLLALFRDNAQGFYMVAMMLTTSVSTMVTQTYNFFKQGKENETTLAEWKTNYEKYLTRIWDRIIEWQKSDINYLCTTYPTMSELFSRTANLDRAVFARSQNDLDFFKITLGSSEQVVPMFEIKNEKKDEIVSEIGFKIHKDDKKRRIEILIPPEKLGKKAKNMAQIEPDGLLTELPDFLANKYFRYLQAENNGQLPPLVLNLKNCGALGIIEPITNYTVNFIDHIVFELAYYHTPEDLQFVFFFEREDDKHKQMERIKHYRNLPHTNELFEDASQFVFNKESAAVVFGKLQAIMGERTKQKSEEEEDDEAQEQQTQIVCIIFDDYDIKETGFSQYLPTPPVEGEEYVNTNGLTFVFACRHLAQLPRYCGNIIEMTGSTGEHAKVSSRYNVLSRETLNNLSKSGGAKQSNTTDDIENLIDYIKFNNNYIFYEDTQQGGQAIAKAYDRAFRQLSAVYYRRVAENGNVPSMVTLFELYGYTPDMVKSDKILNNILESWYTSDVTRNLSVPMGKNEHGIVYLDLYEKADGPHMLVAGTTGSGKSETIITYLIGLCMKYSPTYLNLMLVDMKGGGFSNRLSSLPHCVGVVDDTAGESEGISAVYMLKRFLEVLNAEIKRRKILLNEFGVDTVDAYIRAEKTITKILSGDNSPELLKSLNPKQTEQLYKLSNEGKWPITLSHLVLVVDEFTELKRFSSESDDIDFIAEITTIARVGRTLGFHIILVSQNIEGAITEDIRINSKSRICLKVATRAASKEMLDGRPDAASPTMPGNGRAYLLVGTGSKFMYFQSAYTGANKDENIEPVVTAAQVLPCGNHNKNFYVSTKNNDRIRQSSKNVSEHDTQLSYIVQTINTIKDANDNQQYFSIPREIFKRPLRSETPDPTEWR